MKQPKKIIAQHVAQQEAIDYAAEAEKVEVQKDRDCLNEINATLAKYNRGLAGQITITQGSNPSWKINVVRK